MNKKGFTLIELLFVIVIMSIAGTSSIIIFDKIDSDTALTDRKNMYINIQEAAKLYVDLDDIKLNQFAANGIDNEKPYIYVKVGDLINENYISSKSKDPVTGDAIPHQYMVKLYVSIDPGGNEYMDSCIIDTQKYNPENNKDGIACVSDSEGNESKYCCANKPIPTPKPSNVDEEGKF